MVPGLGFFIQLVNDYMDQQNKSPNNTDHLLVVDHSGCNGHRGEKERQGITLGNLHLTGYRKKINTK